MLILICKAVEGVSFTSHATLGFGARVDLRRDMIEDRSIGTILPKKKKESAKNAELCQDTKTLKSNSTNLALTAGGIIK